MKVIFAATVFSFLSLVLSASLPSSELDSRIVDVMLEEEKNARECLIIAKCTLRKDQSSFEFNECVQGCIPVSLKNADSKSLEGNIIEGYKTEYMRFIRSFKLNVIMVHEVR